jgi:2-iminobutanoate/2-iminopropanoate deaminase
MITQEITMTYVIHDIGVAKQIGKYSDAIETSATGRLLVLSGTPGLTHEGHLPETFEEQAEQAWKNVFALLKHADMGPEHLVKVTQYLTRSEDIPLYPPIRTKWLGDHRPASMLLVIPALVRPEFLIEIEVLAVAP